jgi:N-acetylmuramoyl-L-alanine amidase
MRVRAAHYLKADAFLSILHDSVPERFMETWVYVDKEHLYSDRFKGHSIFVSYDHSDRTGTLLFARLIGQRLKAAGMQYTPHYTEAFMGGRRRELVDADAGVYRFDMLHVLRATHMPAVLFEAGMIINREEELLLASPERQAVIAAAVVAAVEDFCAARSVPRARRGGKAPSPAH